MVKGASRAMTVSRRKVWETSLPYFKRKRFPQNHGRLEVSFTGGDEGDGEREDALDLGGPSREYFRLLRLAIINDSGLLEGM